MRPSAPEHLLRTIVAAASRAAAQADPPTSARIDAAEALLLRFELRDAGLAPHWVRLAIVWTEEQTRVIEREPLDLHDAGGLALEVLGPWRGAVEQLCAAPWATVRLDPEGAGTLARHEMAPLRARAGDSPAEPCHPVAVAEVVQVAVVARTTTGQLLLLEGPLDLASQAGALDPDSPRPLTRIEVRMTVLGDQ